MSRHTIRPASPAGNASRDAFFGEVEQVPADRAVGRICAEMLTPYPPGILAALPGETARPSRGGLPAYRGSRGIAHSRCHRQRHDTIRVSVYDVDAD
ncbi:hypothetical protein ABZS81_23180 [Streptomyces sp. NPDC005318]|uniref:Orn/Lys/Arg family decarboxylase n=1 Tax=Streptomyces sp. NPDC005318 TaxID=3157031 RepID=UPI0033A036A7